MTDADRILHGVIDILMRAKTFSATVAADTAAVRILGLDGLKKRDIPHTLPLVLDGLKHRAKAYKGADGSDRLVTQGDFASIENGFTRLIYAPVALDETHGTRRLPPIEMTLPELKQHIDLKLKKAAQTEANAEMLLRFVELHPNWNDHPKWTLGDVLKRDRGSAAA